MNSPPPIPLLKVTRLEGSRFRTVDVEVLPGSGVILHSHDLAAIDEFVDIINGLEPRSGGEVRFLGSDPAELSDSKCIELRQKAAYSAGSGLISNLKVWENLVLPLQARGLASSAADLSKLEDHLIEAFAVAGLDESWIRANLTEPADRLSEFERNICSLVRSHLTGFDLLIGDGLFEEFDGRHGDIVHEMLDWIGERHPHSGLLLVHRGHPPDRAFGLCAWDPIENVSLEIR